MIASRLLNIVDIVETGTTLRENGLEVQEDVAAVSARLIVNPASLKMRKKELEPLFTQSEIDILDKNSNIEVLFEDKNDKDSVESAKALILKLEESKAIIEAAVRLRAPYLLCKYSQELATAFHHFYNYSRVLTDDKEISAQRLALTKCFKIILGKMLNLLGVSAPEKM